MPHSQEEIEAIKALASTIRLLCLDVDGTLTDGTITIVNNQFIRSYSILDGHGIRSLVQHGVLVAIITAARDQYGVDDIRCRADSLGIHYVYTDVQDKLAIVQELMQKENLTPQQIAFAGDDYADLKAMRYVGLSCAPKTAMPMVLDYADYIPQKDAGKGAIREFCEIILEAQTNTNEPK